MNARANHTLLQKTALYAFLLTFFFSTVFLAVDLTIQKKANLLRSDAVLNHMESIVQTEASSVYERIGHLVSDALYLLDSYRLNLSRGGTLSELEAQWLAFSARNEVYDQIRYLDVAGNEIIRVNYADGTSFLTPEDGLQNKIDRYYFADSINLGNNEIYFSRLDLNNENGEIEQPFKPMMRVCIPYIDESGVTRGEVVLNYLAGDMLEQIRLASGAGESDLFLINSSGGWIVNTADPDVEWSFEYPDRVNNSFSNRYPAAWDSIVADGEGVSVTENGVFAYSSVALDADVDECGYLHVLADGDYYIVAYLSSGSVEGRLFYDNLISMARTSLKENWYFFFSIVLLSVTLAQLLTRKQTEAKRIRFFSEFDMMTGVLNRRAGLSRLNAMRNKAHLEGKALSICFLDINGLKEVNDTFGHEAGDTLINTVANSVRQRIRENDLLARLGGDEFLIVFWDADTARAEHIWARIEQLFISINENESRPYLVSVSHGIAEITAGSNEKLDETIARADKAMYECKREIKRGLRVVRGSAAASVPPEINI
jgi:diguanylate cyclase (GGDEF)-like protein